MYQYIVMVFEKDGDDTLVAQYKINRLTLTELQSLFGIDGYDPMFDCYLVSETQRESIERDIGMRLDIARFDYFVSCESTG